MASSDWGPGSGQERAAERQRLASHWEKARPALSAYITASVYDFHRAEDLLQEVAVIVAGKFHEYDSARPFLAWAMGIARNQVRLYYRQQAKDRHHFSDGTLSILEGAVTQISERELDARREALRHCVRDLDGRRRHVLELRYGGNLSIADVATRLGATPNAIKIVLHRVRRALEECVRRRVAQEARG